MSEDQLDERLREILSNRGRKGTNKLAQIDLIESLVVGAKSPVQRVNIYIALIAAQFDVTTPSQLFMPSNIWRSAVSNVREIIKIARESHPAIEFSDGAEVEVLFVEKKMEPVSRIELYLSTTMGCRLIANGGVDEVKGNHESNAFFTAPNSLRKLLSASSTSCFCFLAIVYTLIFARSPPNCHFIWGVLLLMVLLLHDGSVA